jgi:hypothetical protein
MDVDKDDKSIVQKAVEAVEELPVKYSEVVD